MTPLDIRDTTLATHRALLQFMRIGMLDAADKNTVVVSEPQDFERDNRFGTRVAAEFTPDGRKDARLYAIIEVSVLRGATWIFGWCVTRPVIMTTPRHAPESACSTRST
jgi:hypothetical protein